MEWFEEFFANDYLRFDQHPETPEEVDFIEEALALPKEARILDLCCGYGRHAIELAERGYEVTGYDLSSVLLGRAWTDAVARKVSVRWIRGDVRDLEFEGTHDAVISMFTSIGYFEDEMANFSVLKRIAAALVPGGRLLIETVNRDFVIHHFQPQEWFKIDDNLWVLERRAFDLIESRSHVEVTVIGQGEKKEFRHSVRVYSFTELQLMLASLGLATDGVWGGFEGEDYTWDSPRMIVTATKDANSFLPREAQAPRKRSTARRPSRARKAAQKPNPVP